MAAPNHHNSVAQKPIEKRRCYAVTQRLYYSRHVPWSTQRILILQGWRRNHSRGRICDVITNGNIVIAERSSCNCSHCSIVSQRVRCLVSTIFFNFLRIVLASPITSTWHNFRTCKCIDGITCLNHYCSRRLYLPGSRQLVFLPKHTLRSLHDVWRISHCGLFLNL